MLKRTAAVFLVLVALVPTQARAQFDWDWLGVFPTVGRKDCLGSLRWLCEAAANGDQVSQYRLGIRFEAGRGVPQSFTEAFRWLSYSAHQGYGRAQYRLGVFYAEGRGIRQNYLEAHVWFNLAAAQGIQVALDYRDLVYGYMSPAQVAKAQRIAAEFHPEPPHRVPPAQ